MVSGLAPGKVAVTNNVLRSIPRLRRSALGLKRKQNGDGESQHAGQVAPMFGEELHAVGSV
jgi:hypothetical protein